MDDFDSENAELAYYLEPMQEHPWLIGYIDGEIVEAIEERGYFDPEKLSVTDAGHALLRAMGY